MVSSKHNRTLAAIFEKPTRANVRHDDIIALCRALGADIEEGSGSRVRITLNGDRMTFHRPHPHPETDKGALVAVRKFLSDAGVSQ